MAEASSIRFTEKDGSIAERNSYGNDPADRPG